MGAPSSAGPRVVLAEDNALLREGLQMVLERNGFVVAATAGNAEDLLDVVRSQRIDLVVTDVRMPPGYAAEGLEAATRLRTEQPGLPIVVLSQYVEQSYLADLLDSGSGAAIGYLLKDRVADVADFVDTLHRVLAGGTAVDPAVIAQLIARRRDPLQRLTPRETDVLATMAEGHSNAAIARKLFITEAAVVKHVGNILMKLDLPPNDEQNRRVAAVLAYLRGRPA
ncbi:response regulator transcription factor [Arsenicicoccus dermatophilus]|uniref:response regulator transcription factor n=1 Tax=Arsenicicoccus dermatophilus TaxID=1076331 RepID=UPI0039176632